LSSLANVMKLTAKRVLRYNGLVMANEFSDWLKAEVEGQGWSYRELGRRSDLSGAVISDVVNGRAKPGLRFCVQIARALRVPPENVLRRAGLLPPLPPGVEGEREAMGLFRRLLPEARQAVLMQLRAMTGGLPAVGGQAASREGLAAEGDEGLERQLVDEFRHLPEEWQVEAIREVERLQRLSRLSVRVIGDEGEEQANTL
jgi:transcriptional regulator with XRE-family HTH domain